MPGFHHVEVWVADLEEARSTWGWLPERLPFTLADEWPGGQSWSADGAYLTLTASPNLSQTAHDRRRPGVNHIAFRGGPVERVDAIIRAAAEHGWHALYQDRYPSAGGPGHYAGWLENTAGFKVEIVADGS